MGVIRSEPLAALVKLPCCHCNIPRGQSGLFAVLYVSFHAIDITRHVQAMSLRACNIQEERHTIGNGPVVRLLVVSVRIEGVGYAGVLRLGKLVVRGIVEALFLCINNGVPALKRGWLSYGAGEGRVRLARPGPNQVCEILCRDKGCAEQQRRY